MQRIRKQQGFSLVEMMLAMALGLIVVTGIVQLFIGNSQSSNVISGQARLQENARFAFEFLSAAARRAGYFGCIRDEQTLVWGLVGAPNWLPEYDISASVGGFDAQGVGWTPSITALPGGTPGNTNMGNGIDSAAIADGTDIIFFRNLRQPTQTLVNTLQPLDDAVITAPGGDPGFEANDIVMIADCEQAVVFRVTDMPVAGNQATLENAPNVGGTSGLFQNDVQVEPLNGGIGVDFTNSFLGRSYGPEAIVGEVESTYFFIAESTRPNNANEMPLSLWQKRGPDAPVELIQGVEDMQVRYGIDTTLNDGVANPNRYVTADAIPDPAQVVAINVSLTVNSIDRVTEDRNTLSRTFSKTILIRNANPEV